MMGRKEDVLTLRHRSAGGLVSVGALRALAECAEAQGAQRILLSHRQDLDAPGVARSSLESLWRRFPEMAFEYVHPHTEANILTTAPVAGRGLGRSWLAESVFRDILQAIPFRPAFPVSLVDPSQPYLPCDGRGLCVCALEEDDRWAVTYHPADERDGPILLGKVRTVNVAHVIAAVQAQQPRLRHQGWEAHTLHEAVAGWVEACPVVPRPEAPLRFQTVPDAVSLPMPEGGWRADFIEALCLWAGQRDEVVIRATPWRSFLLPGLGEEDRDSLARLCLSFRTTMEASPWGRWLWYGPDAEGAARRLASQLAVHCGVNPGYGLAIAAVGEAMPPVHARVRYRSGRFHWGSSPWQFRVEGGDAGWLDAAEAAEAVLAHLEGVDRPTPETISLPAAAPAPARASESYCCGECGTTYTPEIGDPFAAIVPGTAFDAVPDDWECPVCGADRGAYVAVA